MVVAYDLNQPLVLGHQAVIAYGLRIFDQIDVLQDTENFQQPARYPLETVPWWRGNTSLTDWSFLQPSSPYSAQSRRLQFYYPSRQRCRPISPSLPFSAHISNLTISSAMLTANFPTLRCEVSAWPSQIFFFLSEGLTLCRRTSEQSMGERARN